MGNLVGYIITYITYVSVASFVNFANIQLVFVALYKIKKFEKIHKVIRNACFPLIDLNGKQRQDNFRVGITAVAVAVSHFYISRKLPLIKITNRE